ncbi:MAG: metallophosphoesterase [Bacteroidetes bacterium]|nr:metallophosphoesterase [Bacteroidota bacterium]
MRFTFSRIIIAFIVVVLLDVYVFQALRMVFGAASYKKVIYALYWLVSIVGLSTLIAVLVSDWHHWPYFIRTYVFAILMSIYFSKVVLLPFLAADDVLRFGKWSYYKVTSTDMEGKMNRNQFILGLGLILSAIPFTTLTWGVLSGPYHFRVRKLTLKFPNLPDAFDGFKVLQLSDIHTGSWIDTAPMKRAVTLINKQKADLVLFTGDIVNDLAEEAHPFIDNLKEVKAPFGVYSSLGNHDYGEYVPWKTPEDKQANFERVCELHNKFEWKLLRNEHTLITKDGQSMVLAGCENWSHSPRFPKYGDLNKTLHGAPENMFTIMMSHDPSHWEAEILKHPHTSDLTLAGHTHGMQFGVDFKWYKWSPVQYFYKQWADLYTQGKQQLYVNRGLGFIGYPGRVGVQPEITVFTLKKG